MNLAELEKKLLAAARRHPPGADVPYAFEQRIMARVAALAAPDRWAWWTGALWRAAGPCLAAALALALWTAASNGTARPGDSLATDLETTLLAGVDTPVDSW